MIETYPSGNKLTGFYRGIVLKHLSKGFCKIWIPSIYPDKYNSYDNADYLPSAEQAAPLSFGTNNGLGIFSYPNIGSIVWCFFANGDQNFPIYFASTLGGPDAIQNWNNAYRKPGGHPNDAYIHKIHVKQSDIEIDECGIIRVHTENNDKSHQCNFEMDSYGNIKLNSTAKIIIETQELQVNGKTQIELKSPNIDLKSDVLTKIESPAIDLDASAGGIVLRSKIEEQKI